MNLRKIAAFLAVAGLSLSMIGAGVGANFTDQVTGSQKITVGVLDIQLVAGAGATVSADGNTVTCVDAVEDNSAGNWSGVGNCSFTVKSVGSIPPANVTMAMSVATDGATLSKFEVAITGPAVLHPSFTLTAGPTPVVNFMGALPATYSTALLWGEEVGTGADLGNIDMGKTIVITYTIVANA
jgi:predicted ribosomally synthesized peptide with SipW-like signal peptide